jgi:hypothetical protein
MSFPNRAHYNNKKEYENAVKKYNSDVQTRIRLDKEYSRANENAYRNGAFDSGIQLPHQRSTFNAHLPYYRK